MPVFAHVEIDFDIQYQPPPYKINWGVESTPLMQNGQRSKSVAARKGKLLKNSHGIEVRRGCFPPMHRTEDVKKRVNTAL